MTDGRAGRDRRVIAAGVAPVAVAIFAAAGSFVHSQADFKPDAGIAIPSQASASAIAAGQVEVRSLRESIAAVRGEIAVLQRDINARNKRVRRAAAEAEARAASPAAPPPATHATTGASGSG